MRLTLLGTGAAGGIPHFRCHCRACRSARADPAQIRRASSARIDTDEVTLFLDAGLTNLTSRLDDDHREPSAILVTHYHVDHVQGLFELRWGDGAPIPVIGPDDPDGCADLHRNPGMLDFSTTAAAFGSFSLGGLRITPVPLIHSKPCLGYVIDSAAGRLAYLTDTVGLPTATYDWLRENPPRLAVIDATHPPTEAEPRNHNNLDQVRALHQDLGGDRTVITHIGHTLAAWLLDHADTLPAGLTVGRDGETIELSRRSRKPYQT